MFTFGLPLYVYAFSFTALITLLITNAIRNCKAKPTEGDTEAEGGDHESNGED